MALVNRLRGPKNLPNVDSHTAHTLTTLRTDPVYDGVSVRLDTTRDSQPQARYIPPLPNRCLKATIYYVREETRGPKTRPRLTSSSHLCIYTYTRARVCILPLFHFPSPRLHFASPGTKVQTGQKNEISLPPLRRRVSREEGLRGGKKTGRGPTGPGVSSRAFLRLILFVGCQPVAATFGPSTRGEGRMRGTSERGPSA